VGDRRLRLTFFDRRKGTAEWRMRHLAAGTIAMFEGKADWDRKAAGWQLVHPTADILERGDARTADEVAADELPRVSSLRPIYPASKKASSWVLESSVRLALNALDDVPEPLPASVRLRHRLLPARQALEWVHRPNTQDERVAAQETLRFTEAFVTQTVLAQRRAELATTSARRRAGTAGGLLDRFDARLPFSLTAGQVSVSEEILADLAGDAPMHRLLQGEVGSGKTVVALRAMLRVVDSGGQAALLAPTEVLAVQHHRTITEMLGDLAQAGMLDGSPDGTRVALVTGSQGATARRQALADAKSGDAGIVVGTHALLEERVQFADLGLVVVDEQHRFGVEQRAVLSAKSEGAPPHVLVMTATPIPRTVAMTVFGDLEVSTLAELPAGRGALSTNVVAVTERPEWLERAWARVQEEARQGRQVYVVCPRISAEDDDDDKGAATDDVPLAAVEEIAPMLAAGALAGLRVEVLHGRLTPERKDAAMRCFASGEADVLVSTTVIEVGVDVPNASMMVVLDAERFGVSQLHQLRGRVGRGGLPGLCLLVTRAAADSAARARLDAVAATLDGFELSRVDLQQRREGDVLGAVQSGRRSTLRLLSVLDHEEVIATAREVAAELVARDPVLQTQPGLAAAVRRLADSEQGDYLERS
jgi:ATP-dependent DNA helicase RecG